MPVETHQLHLKPLDFFTENPGLDMPSTRNKSSVTAQCCSGSNDTARPSEGARASTARPGAASADHYQGSGPEISAEKAGAQVEPR